MGEFFEKSEQSEFRTRDGTIGEGGGKKGKLVGGDAKTRSGCVVRASRTKLDRYKDFPPITLAGIDFLFGPIFEYRKQKTKHTYTIVFKGTMIPSGGVPTARTG